MTRLLVSIVTYNSADEIGPAIESILLAGSGLDLRVMVYDNASVDGTADLIEREWPNALVIRSGSNIGFGRAHNYNVEHAGDFDAVLVLNPDTRLSRPALEIGLKVLASDRQIGMVGGKLVREDGTLDVACRRAFPTPWVAFCRFSGLSKAFPRSHVFARYNLSYLPLDEVADVDAIVGAFMLCRKELVEDIGLFDEDYFMYGEDLDLCMRAKLARWRVLYHPGIEVFHAKGRSARSNPIQAKAAFFDSMRIFYRKHYRRVYGNSTSILVEATIATMKLVVLGWLKCRLGPDRAQI